MKQSFVWPSSGKLYLGFERVIFRICSNAFDMQWPENSLKHLNNNIVQNTKLIWLKKQIRPRRSTWARNKHKSNLWSLVLYIKFQGRWKTILNILRTTGLQKSNSLLDICLWEICLKNFSDINNRVSSIKFHPMQMRVDGRILWYNRIVKRKEERGNRLRCRQRWQRRSEKMRGRPRPSQWFFYT